IANGAQFFQNRNLRVGEACRISGFTFTKVTGRAGQGFTSFGGPTDGTDASKLVQFDNIHVTGGIIAGNGVQFYTFGVMYLCRYDQLDRGNSQNVQNKFLNGDYPYGDKQWNKPANFNSDEWLFVEDSAFHMDAPTPFSAGYGFDGHRGGKLWIRHCHLYGIEILCHGTESGRERGGRAIVQSDNDMHWPYAASTFGGVRSGILVVYNNTLDGPNRVGGWNTQDYRLFHNGGNPWYGADGFNAWDLNDSGNPKETGTVSTFTRISNGEVEIKDNT